MNNIFTQTDTPVQAKAYLVPEEYDIFLGGGRGGGKTVALLKIALRHVEQYGDKANILFLRTSVKGLSGVISEGQLMFLTAPNPPSFNKQDMVFKWPNGATLRFDQLNDEASYAKIQGHNLSLLILDEATQWDDMRLPDMLQSNLRKQGVPVRTVLAANPGGPGHTLCQERFVNPSQGDMIPFTDPVSGRKIVYLHSTFKENHAIDHKRYEQALRTACRGDEALLEAWISGSWSVVRGAFFSTCLTDSRNMVRWPTTDLSNTYGLDAWLAHDQGTARPYVTYVMVETTDDLLAPDGQFYPRGSIIAVDESTSATADALDDGGGMQIPEICADIVAMCSRWNIAPKGVADDALFADEGAGYFNEHFQRHGVRLRPAKKGRRADGLGLMRELFARAQPNGQREEAGLYVDRRCWYFWQTVPSLQTNPRDFEDLAKSSTDHAADALRYGILRTKGGTMQMVAPWDPQFNEFLIHQRMRKGETVYDQMERLKRRGVPAADLAILRGARSSDWRLKK